jgi:hypothetical protein
VRDPAATKAGIEAAIEGACEEFRWLKGRAWFPKKLPFDNQLRYEALDLIKRLPDEVMPPHLRDYICGVLSKEKGLRRTYAAGRDGHIAYAVWDATCRGFSPTRNEATRRKEALGEPAAQSACSIVTKALARVGVHMSERSIEDIWAAKSEQLMQAVEAERLRDELAASAPVVTASTESTPTPPNNPAVPLSQPLGLGQWDTSDLDAQGKPRVR